jgi:hypothetical protein
MACGSGVRRASRPDEATETGRSMSADWPGDAHVLADLRLAAKTPPAGDRRAGVVIAKALGRSPWA